MTGIDRIGSEGPTSIDGVPDPEIEAAPDLDGGGDAPALPNATTTARPKSLDLSGLDLQRQLEAKLGGTDVPTSFRPDLKPVGKALTESLKALAPTRLVSGDPLQLVRGLKDGKVAIEIPLAPGKHKIRGVNVTVAESTVMRVFVEVKDGALVPARDRRGREAAGDGGCKIDFDPPLDLPLVSGKGLYLKQGDDEGGAAGKLKADLGGFFDIRLKETGTLKLDDLVNSLGSRSLGVEEGGAGATGGKHRGEGSLLPAGLLKIDDLKFDVQDVRLTDGVVDTGSVRIDLAPGSHVSLSGTLKEAKLKGDVRIDGLALNQGGLQIEAGAGSASFEARYVKNPDGTMAANTRITNLDATITGAETLRPASAGGGEADHVVLGKTRITNGTIDANISLSTREGSLRPQIAGVATSASFDAEGRIEGAKLTVKDAKDTAELRVGPADFKGKLVFGDGVTKLDGSLKGAKVELSGLDSGGAGGGATLDLHHAKLEGDARITLDSSKKQLDVEVAAETIDVRIDDYKGEKGPTEIDLARTDIAGRGQVHFRRGQGITIDGDLTLKGGFDDLKLAPGGGKATLDLAAGSTIEAKVSHFAAGKATGVELDAKGKVDLGLEKYDVNLPGLTATGDARVTASTTVRLRKGELLLSDVDGMVSVAVADAKVAGGKDFNLDAGKGTKLDLNVQGSTISNDASLTLVKLGKGSKLEAVLDGGQVNVQGRPLEIERGSRARFDITSLTASGAGGTPALRGKLSIDAKVSGAAADLKGLPSNASVKLEIGDGGKAVAKVRVDDVTLSQNGTFSLKGVDVGVHAKVGTVTSATGPAGTRSAADVKKLSASEIAGAGPAAAPAALKPLDIAKRIESGTFEVEIPLEGTVGDAWYKSATFAPGTKVKIALKIKDGKIDPDGTKASISQAGDGPLWVTVNGAYFDAQNTLRLDLGGMKDFAVPGMSDLPRDVGDFIDRLTKPKASGAGGAGGTGGAGGGNKLAALQLDRMHFSVKDARISGGKIPVPGGTIDVSGDTKLSISGTPQAATVSGRVAVNGLELDQDGIALKTGKGALDLKLDFRADGKTGTVTTTLSNMNLDVRYAVQKRENGDYLHLAEGKVEGATLTAGATLALDAAGKPTGAPKMGEVKLTLPKFSGRIEGGRVTIKDADGTAQVELGRTTVKGSVTIDKKKIALTGEVTNLDAGVKSFSGKTKAGSANVESARIQGSAKVKLSTDGKLEVDANVKDVTLKANEIRGRTGKKPG